MTQDEHNLLTHKLQLGDIIEVEISNDKLYFNLCSHRSTIIPRTVSGAVIFKDVKDCPCGCNKILCVIETEYGIKEGLLKSLQQQVQSLLNDINIIGSKHVFNELANDEEIKEAIEHFPRAKNEASDEEIFESICVRMTNIGAMAKVKEKLQSNALNLYHGDLNILTVNGMHVDDVLQLIK